MVNGLKGLSLVAFVSLALGGVAGYLLSADSSASADGSDKAKQAKHQDSPRIRDASNDPLVKSLRARIAFLEKEMKDFKEGLKTQPQTNAAEVAINPPAPPAGPRNWLEDLKKRDPQRYAQMTNNFAVMHRQRLERQRRKLDFLESVDTSHMSEDAKQTHLALQESIALQEELIARMRELHEGGNDDPEARREIGRQLRENAEQQRELRQKERDNLFEQTATQLGFEGDDAKGIVETLKDIIEATDDSWGGPGRGMRRGGGPRPPR